MKIMPAVALVCLFIPTSVHAKAPVESLSCIEQSFTEDQAKAMAEMGSGDVARSKPAQSKVDFMMMGFTSRICAKRHNWSENQYFNAIGYMMAWPTMRGLQLLGAASGYDAIDRAWTSRAAEWTKKKRLTADEVDALLAEAAQDGLAINGEAGKKDAHRYAEALQQIAAMRDDFAADRKPRSRN